MLMLFFSVGDERYAIESREIVEIIPLVLLKTFPQKPEHIAGVFNYRGCIVPVIDLCQLMQGKPCSDNLSTRIILVNYCGHILGLMAEQVVETLHKSESEFVDSHIQIDAAPYLGKMILDDKGMIQCIRIEYLLSEVEQVHLLPQSHLSTVI